MFLAEYIAWLEMQNEDFIMPVGFTNAHSYRGYYRDLAFEPRYDLTIKQMLSEAKAALDQTFEGYKGGDFTMGKYTEVWFAEYGETGDTISKLLLDAIHACGIASLADRQLKYADSIELPNV